MVVTQKLFAIKKKKFKLSTKCTTFSIYSTGNVLSVQRDIPTYLTK